MKLPGSSAYVLGMLKTAIAALCVAALAGPAWAETCDGKMPPKSARQKPTVYYDQYIVTPAQFSKLCPFAPLSGTGIACAYPSPTKAHPDRWQIVLIDSQTLFELGCSVTYELAHLPPNYWADPSVESAEAINWLKNQRR